MRQPQQGERSAALTKPRFTEEEMAVILRRAAALQEARDGRTHSLAEIQEIALQVGIDPGLVAHVARHPVLATRKRGWLAAPPTTAVDERRVDSKISVADYSLILDGIRRAGQTQGHAQQVFDSLEWRSGSDRDEAWVAATVTARPEATYVRVEGNIDVRVALAHIVGIAPLFAALGASFSLLPASAAITTSAIAGVGILAGIRAIWRRWLGRMEERVHSVADEIEQYIRRAAAAATVPAGADSAERQLPSEP